MDVDEYPDPDDVGGLSDADEAMAAEFEEEFGLPDELDALPIRPTADKTAAGSLHEPTAEPEVVVEAEGADVTMSDDRAPQASSVHTETCGETDLHAEVEARQVQMHFIVPGHHGEADAAVCDVEVRLMARKARTPLRIDASGQMLLPISTMIDNVERDKLAAGRKAKVVPHTMPTSSDLWVERYAPRSFMELLSDERLNRQVLHWVKEWEGHVFGKGKRTNRGPDDAFGGAARNADRPERPLLLLSGPPGLGKTTLVKVVAKHAGYRLMEINASDDRSAKMLKQRIKEATEVQPVFGTRKPVLVVLDEIDGAMGGSDGSGAISELLRLASATGAGGGSGAENGSKSKGWDGLHRPVICICNDLYAPALRPLRDVAEVLQFKSGRGASLVFRLKAVCNKEGLKVDDHTLNKLAQMADGDVRACLNTLQFARMRSNVLTYETLLTMPIGNKDHAKGALDLWKQVFILPSASSAPRAQTRQPPVRSRSGAGAKGVEFNNTRQTALFDALHRADVGRVIDGLHENYLTVGYPDPSLSRTADAAEWLSIHQVRTHAQYSQGQFALMRYAEFSVLGVQHSCSVAHTKDQLRFPKAAAEQRAKQRQNTQLLASWRAGMPARVSRCYNSATLVTDLVSPLLSLLCPPFRSTSSHILNTEEKQMLTSLVDNMMSFGLCLKHSHQSDAGHSLVLDPPLSLLLPRDSTADGSQAHDAAAELAAQLPNHIRQLLAAELQRETLRRHYGAIAAPSASKPATEGAAPQPVQPLSAAEAAKSIKAPLVTPTGPVNRDMFGRPVGDKSRKRILGSHGSAASDSAGPVAVRYKFQEGVTNAVRRTVRIQDLL